MRPIAILLLSMVCLCLFGSEGSAADAPFGSQVAGSWALVLTGPESGEPYLRQTTALREAAPEIQRRGMAVIRFTSRALQTVKELSAVDYEGRILDESSERRYMEQRLQTQNESFSLVLVAPDGAVAKVWTEPVEAAEIFTVIDAPPLP